MSIPSRNFEYSTIAVLPVIRLCNLVTEHAHCCSAGGFLFQITVIATWLNIYSIIRYPLRYIPSGEMEQISERKVSFRLFLG